MIEWASKCCTASVKLIWSQQKKGCGRTKKLPLLMYRLVKYDVTQPVTHTTHVSISVSAQPRPQTSVLVLFILIHWPKKRHTHSQSVVQRQMNVIQWNKMTATSALIKKIKEKGQISSINSTRNWKKKWKYWRNRLEEHVNSEVCSVLWFSLKSIICQMRGTKFYKQQ